MRQCERDLYVFVGCLGDMFVALCVVCMCVRVWDVVYTMNVCV